MTVKNDLDYLLDLFGGADGGVGFIKLRMFLETLEQKADAGDGSAQELLRIVSRFRQLIEIAQR